MWEFLAGLGIGNMLNGNGNSNRGEEFKQVAHSMGQIDIIMAAIKAGKRVENELNQEDAGKGERYYAYRAFQEILKEIDVDALPDDSRKTYRALCSNVNDKVNE